MQSSTGKGGGDGGNGERGGNGGGFQAFVGKPLE